jgi:hypothetical protein
MTRKDFVVIARALGIALSRQDLTVDQIEAIIQTFTSNIQDTNPNFKRHVFVNAVRDNTFSK